MEETLQQDGGMVDGTGRSRMPRLARFALITLLALVLSAAIFSAGIVTGAGLITLRNQPRTQSPILGLSETPIVVSQTNEDVDFGVFWEVWNTLEDRFYGDLPSEEERVQGAIQGLIESLDDPYTAYVEPRSARILREDDTGSFEGIGAYVEEAPAGGVYIIRVFEGGPADLAGVRAGDVVISADGVDVTGMILNEALLLIRGPANSQVTLRIVREGEPEPLELTITRARLEVPTIESRMLNDNIGYIALFEFNARASSRLRTAVRDLVNSGAESLVLDLRNNPGGYLDESIAVADMFLPRGLILIQRDVDGNERRYNSRDGDFAESIPLVVLINRGSASASEIVAAALRDNGRATLIGEQSFGKGSVQLQYTLSDESLLRVTYANWYTPNNESLSGNGIQPDILVETPQDPDAEDVQLERAIQFLTTGQ